MATSEGEVTKGKKAFAYLLNEKIEGAVAGKPLPAIVGDFLCEMVDNRVAGGASTIPENGHATPKVTVTDAPMEIAPSRARMIEAPPAVEEKRPSAGGGRGGKRTNNGWTEASRHKAAATRAATKAAKGR